MVTAKVLFVDDDERLLRGLQRQLSQQFSLDCANDALAAQRMLAESGPYAVVVSDMRMPRMTGIEFLAHVRDAYPETVRIMLTGEADLRTTIDAVNEGHLFRFLTKPCTAEVLERALTQGVRHYQLVCSERELVQGTLKGSVKILSEMLSLLNPLAFGRAARVERLATRVGKALQMPNLWELEIAALLSQLGCVAVPAHIVEKISRGDRLSDAEQQAYQQHSELGFKLLQNIPRLETVAESIRYQSQHFDGSGSPGDGVKGEALPLGARILHAVLSLDRELVRTSDPLAALRRFEQDRAQFDPKVVNVLKPIVIRDCGLDVFPVKAADLSEGMYFAADVMSTAGVLLVAKGQEVTSPLRMKLISMNGTLREPLSVYYLPENLSNIP